jgi:uncharacterized membrane protein YedE/YeeE
MTIDWTHFTPWSSLAGGVLIGIAAAMLVVFGVGWGLAGYCPGPALVSLGAGQDKAVVFVAAMLGGMLIYTALERYMEAPRKTR